NRLHDLSVASQHEKTHRSRNWNLLSEQLQGNLRKRAYDRLCKPAVAAPPSAKTGGQEYSYTYTCAEGDHRELARILPTVGHRLIVGVGKNLARLLVSLADSLNRLIVGSLNAAADVRSDFTRALRCAARVSRRARR